MRRTTASYLQTNEQLSALLLDLTGQAASRRTSKKVLVARIERNESKKRKVVEDEGDKESSKKSKKTTKPVKPPQGCLAELTPGQIAQMKRMRITPEQMKIYTHR